MESYKRNRKTAIIKEILPDFIEHGFEQSGNLAEKISFFN